MYQYLADSRIEANKERHIVISISLAKSSFSIYEGAEFHVSTKMQSMQKAIVISHIIVKNPHQVPWQMRVEPGFPR